MRSNRTIVAASVLLAAGCVTAPDGPAGTVDGAYEYVPARIVNADQVLRMLERTLAQAWSPERPSVTIRSWLNVDAEGIVRSAEIAESSGDSLLDAAVLGVVRRLRFKPARRYGTPVEARVLFPVSLMGDGPAGTVDGSRTRGASATRSRLMGDGPAGTADGVYEYAPPKEVNTDEVLRLMERTLAEAWSPGTPGGTIRLWLNVDAEGTVRSAEVAESSGDSQLDAAMLGVVRRLRYEPARRHGKPVEARIPYTVSIMGG